MSRKRYLLKGVQEVFNNLFKLCSQLTCESLCSRRFQLVGHLAHNVLFRLQLICGALCSKRFQLVGHLTLIAFYSDYS